MQHNEQFPRGLLTPVNALSKGYPVTKFFRNYLQEFNVAFYDPCCPAVLGDFTPVRSNDAGTEMQYYNKGSKTWISFPLATGGGTQSGTVQWSVLEALDTPDGGAVAGNIYLVGPTGLGAFAGHANEIATYDGSIYTFQVPTIGDLLLNANTDLVYEWTGSLWVSVGRIALHQGGDTYSAPIVMGSKDNFPVSFIQNNVERMNIDTSNHFLNIPTAVRFTGGGLGTGVIFGDSNISMYAGFDSYMYHKSNSGRWRFLDPALDIKLEMVETRTSIKYPTVIGNVTAVATNDSMLEVRSIQKGFLLPRMTKAQRNLINLGVTSGTIVGGSGYTNGVYSIAMSGGSGLNILANITVVGGAVTIVSTPGANTDGQYLVGDVLTAAIPGGSGFTYTVTVVTPPTAGMAVYQTDNTPGLRVWNGTSWMRYTETAD